MTAAPVCWDCEWHDRGFPCRTDGKLDFDRLAQTYLDDVETDPDADLHWCQTCVMNLEANHPDRCFALVMACLPKITTRDQAGIVAAGPLEELVAQHGDAMIGRIEDMARQSARFRYVLSGVWPQGEQDGPIWARVLQARSPGPSIEDDGPIPDL